MNVLQRGVRSVLRKPIKSIILLFIVIVMSGLFLGAMASRSASIYTQDATRQAIRRMMEESMTIRQFM